MNLFNNLSNLKMIVENSKEQSVLSAIKEDPNEESKQDLLSVGDITPSCSSDENSSLDDDSHKHSNSMSKSNMSIVKDQQQPLQP